MAFIKQYAMQNWKASSTIQVATSVLFQEDLRSLAFVDDALICLTDGAFSFAAGFCWPQIISLFVTSTFRDKAQ